MSIVHRCSHCNRTLSDPDSMKIGYGPVCYKKIFGIPLKKIKSENKVSRKVTKKILDLSESYDLEEVFKDVY